MIWFSAGKGLTGNVVCEGVSGRSVVQRRKGEGRVLMAVAAEGRGF
jgi:hypothetical protein